jgi:hypothetical protein
MVPLLARTPHSHVPAGTLPPPDKKIRIYSACAETEMTRPVANPAALIAGCHHMTPWRREARRARQDGVKGAWRPRLLRPRRGVRGGGSSKQGCSPRASVPLGAPRVCRRVNGRGGLVRPAARLPSPPIRSHVTLRAARGARFSASSSS